MKISDIAAQSGLSISTIRYYERTGLCPPIMRGPDGQRRYSAHDLDWFMLLSSLRETGMPMAEMQNFAALYRSGNKTVPERKAALLQHQKRLDERQAELDRCRAILAHKLSRYDEITGEYV